MKLYDLFIQQVQEKPSKVAIIYNDSKITYEELFNKVKTISTKLKQIKHNNNDPTLIGILMRRSPEMVASILATFDIESSFLPLDVSLPKNRLIDIIEDSSISYLVSEKEIVDNIIDSNQKKSYDLLKNKIIVDYNDSKKNYQLSNTAYVIYTSGSSGKPKGVSISQDSLSSFNKSITQLINLNSYNSILASTTIAFDISLLETIVALANGLTIILANEKEQKNPNLLANLLQRYPVDIVQMTPSMMQLFVNHSSDLGALKVVKEIMIGGEPFPKPLLSTLRGFTDAKIYNMYGPTESTIWCCAKELINEKVTIGLPLVNNEIYIVDNENNILRDGEQGEICICGDQLANGYLNNIDFTNQKFIVNKNNNRKMYKTGDLGRRLENGEIIFMGRMDSQIKIKGYRVELEEIENKLAAITDIDEACVVVNENNDGDKYLYCYYTSDREISTEEIRRGLFDHLPEYMIPLAYNKIDRLPLSNNGKIDRKALLDSLNNLLNNKGLDIEVEKEESTLDEKVLSIVRKSMEVFGVHDINSSKNLKDIGLDSVTFVKIIVSLEVEFDIEFDDDDLDLDTFIVVQDLIDCVKKTVYKSF